MSLDAETVFNGLPDDSVRLLSNLTTPEYFKTDINPNVHGDFRPSTPEEILARIGADSISLNTKTVSQEPYQLVAPKSMAILGETFDDGDYLDNVADSSPHEEVDADAVPKVLELENELWKIDGKVRAAEIKTSKDYQQTCMELSSQLSGLQAHGRAIRTHGISKAEALLARAKELAVQDVQRSEILGAQKVSDTRNSVNIYEHQMVKHDLPSDLREFLDGFKPEQRLADAIGEASALVRLTESDALESLLAAKDKAQSIIDTAFERAEELLNINAPKIIQRFQEVSAEVPVRIMKIRAAADSTKREIAREILEIEHPNRRASQGRRKQRSSSVRPKPRRFSLVPESKIGRRIAAGTLAAGVALGGLEYFTDILPGDNGSAIAVEQETIKDSGAAVPDWENFPLSVAAWQSEMADTITDPRIAVDQGGKKVNYIAGDGTAKNPGNAALLYTLMMVESQGDPAKTAPSPTDPTKPMSIPLIAVSPTDGARISQELGLSDASTDHEKAKNLLLVTEKHANEIIAGLMSDPQKSKIYETQPQQLFIDVLTNWGLNVQLNVEGIAQICVDWNNRAKKSEVFDNIVKDPTWQGLFASALKSVKANQVLTATETK